MPILKDFYKGRIQPPEYFAQANPENSRIEHKIRDIKDEWLRKKLSEEDFQKFEDDLQTLYFSMVSHWEERGFTYGFKLGAMIMIDVLSGSEEIIEGT